MSEWQPIETAPKDGTDIVVAAFDEYEGRWRFREDYWRTYRDGRGAGFGMFGELPTHWMPLPEPPAKENPQ